MKLIADFFVSKIVFSHSGFTSPTRITNVHFFRQILNLVVVVVLIFFLALFIIAFLDEEQSSTAFVADLSPDAQVGDVVCREFAEVL